MGKLIYRIYSRALIRTNKWLSDLRFEALCAVVDKLPVGRTITAQDDLFAEGIRRNHELPVAAAGYEGFAYVSLPAACSSLSNLPSSSASSGPGAIDFVTAAPPGDTTEYEVLRLPLANTVFQTGTPTTMFLLRFETAEEGPILRKVSKTKLSHQQVRINAQSTDPTTEKNIPGMVTSLSIPLLPLTEPRRVKGCMGNIIRRIIGPKGDKVTASSELEDVVPRFFQARGEPVQATTAWALVIPSNLQSYMRDQTRRWLAPETDKISADEWESKWRTDPPVWSSIVADAIVRGARLHRVLSGGGGWGKKAGLLSLDPVPVNEPSDSSSTEEMPSTVADPEDFASTLTPVVNDGDLIQFFIQPTSYVSAEAARYDNAEQLKSIKDDGVGWELGTIPSTVDSIPGKSWQQAEPVSTEVSIFKRTFGALTEGPVTLTKRILHKDSLVDSTSTIDVPFTRFWKVDIEPLKTEKGKRGLVSGVEKDATRDVGERRIAG